MKLLINCLKHFNDIEHFTFFYHQFCINPYVFLV